MLAAWALTLCLLSMASALQAASRIEPNLLVFSVNLDQAELTDGLTAYEVNHDVLLPLGELARLLTLGITVDAETKTASGFILDEKRGFRVDTVAGTAAIDHKDIHFDPASVRWLDDDLYVPSKVLQQWLPADFELQLSRLAIVVHPREKLPVQARLEREAAARLLHPRDTQDTASRLPIAENPYTLASVPFIDLTMGAQQASGAGPVAWSNSAFITGDLLGMESAIYLSDSNTQPSPKARVTLARNDPSGELFGPLAARTVAVGNVSVPGVVNVLRGGGVGNGALISNRPIGQSGSFGVQTLRGDLPPGWDVTLYYNDALLGYQQSRTDGLYVFEDLPLAFGANEFRLVFQGPLGQTRVERHVYMLDQQIAKPGELLYTAAAQQLASGGRQSVLQLDFGLFKHLGATAGVVSVPTTAPALTSPGGGLLGASSNTSNGGLAALPGLTPATPPDNNPLVPLEIRQYANLGLRGSLPGVLLNTDYVQGFNTGHLFDVGLRTQIRHIAATFTYTDIGAGFLSSAFSAGADPVRIEEKAQLTGFVPLSSTLRLPVGVDITRDLHSSGTEDLSARLRLSLNLPHIASLTNAVQYIDHGGAHSMDGALQVLRRVAGIGLSGQLGYLISPTSKLTSVALTADRSIDEHTHWTLGWLRSMDSKQSTYAAGITHTFKSLSLGLSAAQMGPGNFMVGLQAFVAIGRHPTSGRWLFDSMSMAGSGAVSARAFIDGNGNGVYDPTEALIPNAGFIVNRGGRLPQRTDENGLTLLSRLAPYQSTDVELDPGTLEDPQWTPTSKGVHIVPRPGKVQALDFPVVLTSEVDGTIYVNRQGKETGIGNVLVELVNGSQDVVASARSSWDGYYVMQSVRPGTYVLRISPEQLQALRITADHDVPVTVPANGDLVTGIDFHVSKTHTATSAAGH